MVLYFSWSWSFFVLVVLTSASSLWIDDFLLRITMIIVIKTGDTSTPCSFTELVGQCETGHLAVSSTKE